MTRDKVLATAVRLLEITLIRVGNAQYAKQNRSYGLTTLNKRHLDVDGAALSFAFRGKSGVDHKVSVRDRRLADRGPVAARTAGPAVVQIPRLPTATCARSPPTT